MTRPKISERLLKMLRELGLDLPEDARLERAAGSYAGWNRSSLGAWVWTAVRADGVPVHQDSKGRPMAIGSQWTMTELVRFGVEASRDSGGDIHIDPPVEAQHRVAHEEKDRKEARGSLASST